PTTAVSITTATARPPTISAARPGWARRRAATTERTAVIRLTPTRITGKQFRLVSREMARKPPRYDVPNAAPEPLRLVQRVVNTINLESGEDWLARWFDEEGVATAEAELERARVVREAIRELLFENNRQRGDGDARAVLTAAADAAALSIDFAE